MRNNFINVYKRNNIQTNNICEDRIMYKNYIFDLYGTLIDINTNEISEIFWQKLAYYYNFLGASYSMSELRREYKLLCHQEEKLLSGIDYPEIEITKVFQALFFKKSVCADISLAEEAGKVFRILSIDYIRLYEGVIELLGSLKQAGKRIYLLSNAQRIFTEPEMKMLNIDHYFDGILFSSDCRCKKPSSTIYQAILNQYSLDKKESIMIGNDPTADIKGAHEVGLPSLYIHSNLSPDDTEELFSDYTIIDGDVSKIKSLLQLC